MVFNFPLILLGATIFSGAVILTDHIFIRWIKKRTDGEYQRAALPVVIDYCRSLFPVFLVVFLIRSFVIQPYTVPSGSLEPTVVPGDFMLVNQYSYGITMPIWNKQLIAVGKPQRGQIALFYYPVNPQLTFVKRVIGLPGDRISYIDRVLYINGKKMTQTFVKDRSDIEQGEATTDVKIYQEDLDGLKHDIQIDQRKSSVNFKDLVVPKGEYFMMGDNRDNSDDSRYWGFVPENDFLGKAMFIWLSWDKSATQWSHKVRWERIGDSL